MRVRYDRVSFAYESTNVLTNISCEFEFGKTVLLVGHNGSGKSTFLRLMNGLLKPTEGDIHLDGVNTKDKRASQLAKMCALSFQNPDDQLFAPTVRKEISFGIENTKGNDTLFDPVVGMLHLNDYIESNPYSLPYALRRLVAIAGSAAMNTPILALDEPTAGLSLREKNYLRELIPFLKSRSKTIVIVTHDLNFLLPFADKLLLLSCGEIKYFGDRDKFFDRKDARSLMRGCGIKYPIYVHISSALGLTRQRFDAEEILEELRKKRAGATQNRNGQHQLEGAKTLR